MTSAPPPRPQSRSISDGNGTLNLKQLQFLAAVQKVLLIILFGSARKGKSKTTNLCTNAQLEYGPGDESITKTLQMVGPLPLVDVFSNLFRHVIGCDASTAAEGAVGRSGFSGDTQVVFVDTRGLGDTEDSGNEWDIVKSLSCLLCVPGLRVACLRGTPVDMDFVRGVVDKMKLCQLTSSMASAQNTSGKTPLLISKAAHEMGRGVDRTKDNYLRENGKIEEKLTALIARENRNDVLRTMDFMVNCLPDISNEDDSVALRMNCDLVSDSLVRALQKVRPEALLTGSQTLAIIAATWEALKGVKVFTGLDKSVFMSVMESVRKTQREKLVESAFASLHARLMKLPKSALEVYRGAHSTHFASLVQSVFDDVGVTSRRFMEDVPYTSLEESQSEVLKVKECVKARGNAFVEERFGWLRGFVQYLGHAVHLLTGKTSDAMVLDVDMTSSTRVSIGGGGGDGRVVEVDSVPGVVVWDGTRVEKETKHLHATESLHQASMDCAGRVAKQSNVTIGPETFAALKGVTVSDGVNVSCGSRSVSGGMTRTFQGSSQSQCKEILQKWKLCGEMRLVKTNAPLLCKEVEDSFRLNVPTSTDLLTFLRQLHVYFSDKYPFVIVSRGWGTHEVEVGESTSSGDLSKSNQSQSSSQQRSRGVSGLGSSGTSNTSGVFWGENVASSATNAASERISRLKFGSDDKPASVTPYHGHMLVPVWEMMRDQQLAQLVKSLYAVYEAVMCPPSSVDELRRSLFYRGDKHRYVMCQEGDPTRHFVVDGVDGNNVCVPLDPTSGGTTSTVSAGTARSDRAGTAIQSFVYDPLRVWFNPETMEVDVTALYSAHGIKLRLCQTTAAYKSHRRSPNDCHSSVTVRLCNDVPLVFDRLAFKGDGFVNGGACSANKTEGDKAIRVVCHARGDGDRHHYCFGSYQPTLITVSAQQSPTDSLIQAVASTLSK